MKIENAIEVNNVSMCFNLSKQKVDNIKEYVIRALKRQLFTRNSGRCRISASRCEKAIPWAWWA